MILEGKKYGPQIKKCKKTNYMLSPTVIGVGLHRLGLKSIEVKLKSNETKPSWTSAWPKLTSLELHEVIHHRLQSSPSRPWWSPTRRSNIKCAKYGLCVFSFQNERNSCNTIGIKDRTTVKNIDFFGHVMSSHHSEQMSQRSQVSRIALCMSKVKVLSVSQWVSQSVHYGLSY